MLKIIYSPLHKNHHPSYNINDGQKASYPEVPERIEVIKDALEKEGLGIIEKPMAFSASYIDAIHLSNYRKFLEKKSQTLTKDSNFFTSDFIMDISAPMMRGTYIAAKNAVDVGLTGAKFLQCGEKLVYSLCRPPGHHAGHVSMGGFCYFNNAAIAANYLSTFGTVAILDIDYHHGNGIQQAFYHRADVLYVSLHADPNKDYPYISGFVDEEGIGLGEGFTKNYPLALQTSEAVYRKTLQKALKNITDFNPTFLIVSAGFDTYIHDPIAGFRLDIPFYNTIGKDISSLKLPTLVIQEGGYNVDHLGAIAVSFVKGLLSNTN